MRHIGPTRNPGMGPLFLGANRNKRGIVLDLKKAADREQLFALIRDADALVSNIRPQAMARLGLSYEDAVTINPSIIYCAAVGYGQGGPYAGRAVYDDLMQAASGVAGMFERVDGKPRYAPINLCDRVVGLHVVIAVLAALHHRLQTGEGQKVEVPMFETMAQFVLADHAGGRAYVPALGATGYGRLLSRRRGPYATRDGYLSLVVYTDSHWRKFGEIVGRAALIEEDVRFRSMQSRTTHAESVGDFLAQEIARRTTDDWLDTLGRFDIPASRVNSVDDLFDDAHLKAVGFFRHMDHPTEGPLMVARSPLQFSRTPLEIERLAPRLGEHSAAIAAASGWTGDKPRPADPSSGS
jgi:crotonobetainyl-CoA:carnitine CoA-transferase CaiB-like acyl-CoA transferase